jgi:hypothetical protein
MQLQYIELMFRWYHKVRIICLKFTQRYKHAPLILILTPQTTNKIEFNLEKWVKAESFPKLIANKSINSSAVCFFRIYEFVCGDDDSNKFSYSE